MAHKWWHFWGPAKPTPPPPVSPGGGNSRRPPTTPTPPPSNNIGDVIIDSPSLPPELDSSPPGVTITPPGTGPGSGDHHDPGDVPIVETPDIGIDSPPPAITITPPDSEPNPIVPDTGPDDRPDTGSSQPEEGGQIKKSKAAAISLIGSGGGGGRKNRRSLTQIEEVPVSSSGHQTSLG